MNTLDQTFAALSDSTRRAIVARLLDGELALSDIAAPFEMSQTAVSKHVNILNNAGLVEVTKRGRTRFCRLRATPLQDVSEWLRDYQAFWENSFESLANHLEDNP